MQIKYKAKTKPFTPLNLVEMLIKSCTKEQDDVFVLLVEVVRN